MHTFELAYSFDILSESTERVKQKCARESGRERLLREPGAPSVTVPTARVSRQDTSPPEQLIDEIR